MCIYISIYIFYIYIYSNIYMYIYICMYGRKLLRGLVHHAPPACR